MLCCLCGDGQAVTMAVDGNLYMPICEPCAIDCVIAVQNGEVWDDEHDSRDVAQTPFREDDA